MSAGPRLPFTEPAEAPLSPAKAAWRIWRTRDNLAAMPKALYTETMLVKKAGRRRIFYCVSPETVRHVLREARDSYSKSSLTRLVLSPSIGRGLFVTEGAEWRRQRRAIAPIFQSRVLDDYSALISGHGRTMAEALLAGGEAGVDAVDLSMAATYQAILDVMFVDGAPFDTARMHKNVERYFTGISAAGLLDLIEAPPWIPRLKRTRSWPARRYLQREITRFIDERKAGEDPGRDLLGRLILARDPETGVGLEDEEIRDNLLTLIVAGHETSSMAIAWTLFLLAVHPEIQDRLAAEIAAVFAGRGDDLADLKDAGEIPYLDQVLNESMRLYPPGPILTRVAQAEDEVGGETVRPGDMMMLPIFALHRHQLLWERPDVFDPDRFGSDKPKPDRFAFLPFGGGHRICVGSSFAMAEMRLMLIEILRRTEVRLAPGARMETQMLITLRPRHGVLLTARRR